MKSVLAVFVSLLVFVAAWMAAGALVYLLSTTWPHSMFGEKADAVVKKLYIWLLGPGVGGYCAVKLTSKWFKSVSATTIHVGFLGVFVTLMVLVLGFNVLMLLGRNPYNTSWFEAVSAIAQSAAAIYGAYLAKKEIPEVMAVAN